MQVSEIFKAKIASRTIVATEQSNVLASIPSLNLQQEYPTLRRLLGNPPSEILEKMRKQGNCL